MTNQNLQIALNLDSLQVLDHSLRHFVQGIYQGKEVACQLLNFQLVMSSQESLSAFVKSKLPFWLSTIGIGKNDETKLLYWVMEPQAKTTVNLNTFLHSKEGESWSLRVRLLRDIGMAIYQRRVIGANHIGWDAQIYVDKEGRVL